MPSSSAACQFRDVATLKRMHTSTWVVAVVGEETTSSSPSLLWSDFGSSSNPRAVPNNVLGSLICGSTVRTNHAEKEHKPYDIRILIQYMASIVILLCYSFYCSHTKNCTSQCIVPRQSQSLENSQSFKL